jgi:hypothetical protein
MTNNSLRVIAIDPTSRGFAYAVLEGLEHLVDWGLSHVLLKTDANILSRIERIIARSHPDLLVLEDGRGTRRGERAQRIIKGVEELAKRRGLPVMRVSRSQVREALKPASTKQHIALGVASIFPELGPRMPRPRKPWTAEDERMNIFDAVSFALTALEVCE